MLQERVTPLTVQIVQIPTCASQSEPQGDEVDTQDLKLGSSIWDYLLPMSWSSIVISTFQVAGVS